MERKHSRLLGITLGLLLSAAFLYFTFRGTDLGSVFSQMGAVEDITKNRWEVIDARGIPLATRRVVAIQRGAARSSVVRQSSGMRPRRNSRR